MEQVESIPFSGLIAGMLLYKRSCTSIEVANVLCRLENYGIYVDDENDNLDCLSCCVEASSNYSCFCLKNGFGYNTVLLSGVEVSEFLKIHTNDKILSIIGESVENFAFQETSLSKVMDFEKVKKKKNFFSLKKKILAKKKKDSCHNSFMRDKRQLGGAIL